LKCELRHFAFLIRNEWWDTEPPVRLLDVTPIYESEAEMLESLKPEMRRPLFVQATLREKETEELNNPHREPIDLITQATESVWAHIPRWYKQNAPRIYKQLGKGAMMSEVRELEARLGVKLPEDFVASLRTYRRSVGRRAYFALGRHFVG